MAFGLACFGLAAVMVGLVGCGTGDRSSICRSHDTLRAAVRTMDSARSAVAANDDAAVGRLMDEVDRLLRAARRAVSSGNPDAATASAARAMLEAANYLGYMTGQFRSTGSIDFSLTQFASRELNRAASGAGGAPLNC